MKKFSIKNRYGLKLVGELREPDSKVGLVFLIHGLSGFKEQEHIQAIVETFFENGYTVVNIDATNSFNESEGEYENATLKLHYEDLCDVINWATTETWYQEKFVVAGSSMGGYAALRFAEEYPEKVESVYCSAPVISGLNSLNIKQKLDPEGLRKWQETGWEVRVSKSRPGLVMRLPWSHMQERLEHDLIPKAGKLTMPILITVGEYDESCPLEHQQMLFDVLPHNSYNQLSVIEGARHTLREERHIRELKEVLNKWVKNIQHGN